MAIRPSNLSDPCDRGTASQVSIDAIWKSDKESLAVKRKALWPCALEFVFFKEHISSEFRGVPMPLTGAIPEGPSFFCPHCGALYAVTYSRLSDIDSNVARCVVCGQIMDKWDSTKVPTFKLIHRPEDH